MIQAGAAELVKQVPLEEAVDLVDGLPQGAYEDHRQPTFPREALVAAVHELQNTEGVTTPENVQAVKDRLAAVATGECVDAVVITAGCAETVDARVSISSLVNEGMQMLSVARRGLGGVFALLRNRGQSGKPRSSEHEILEDGTQVQSFMGDMVNGADRNKREPDSTRLVAAAVMARDLEAGLTEDAGEHIPAAHEALVLPYEKSFIRADGDGRLWLLSADLPWVGDRTRDPNGPHVEMLSRIENPVGVKLGPSATAEDVKALYDKLNPNREAGKIVFMLRTGLDNEELTGRLLDAIKEHASNSVLLYDIHGSTVTDSEGRKVRAVSRIIDEVRQLHRLCKDRGLHLHGVHLETQAGDDRLECVDEIGEAPKDKPTVDPLLSARQALRVYHALGDLLIGDELERRRAA